jgi:flagellar motility protein MotE (MotC chaperone)
MRSRDKRVAALIIVADGLRPLVEPVIIVLLENELGAVRDNVSRAERTHGEALAATQARAVAADKQVAELQGRIDIEQKNAESSRVAVAEARIKTDAAADAVRTLGAENKTMRTELRELHKSTAAAEQRAAVAEARSRNRDEQLVELRQAFEALRQLGQEQQGRCIGGTRYR